MNRVFNMRSSPAQLKKWELRAQAAFRSDLRADLASLTTRDDVDGIMGVLREAREAMTTIRSPRSTVDADGVLQNDYMLVPDWGARLAAVKLHMAYLWGLPESRTEVKLEDARASDDQPQSTDDRIAMLRAAGVDVREVVESWLSMAQQVGDTLPAGSEQAQEVKNLTQDIARQTIVEI